MVGCKLCLCWKFRPTVCHRLSILTIAAILSYLLAVF